MKDQVPAVVVKDLYKRFKLPHEQHSGIKQLIVNFAKRKKGYETQHVLDDISFEIKKGEFFGIVGRNGSGKSTLLKLLAGIYTPDRGLVQVNGSLTPFIELGVGFNPELTGRENVFLNGALLGFGRTEMEAMYEEIVEFAELHKFMDQKLKNYSSGMQVRLAFSIAIRARSDVLILDEVLAVGDQAFQQKCYSYFERLKKQGQTVVLVTHDMSAVQRFCSRALLISEGKIKYIGEPFEIADRYTESNVESSQNKNSKEVPETNNQLKAEIIRDTKEYVQIGFNYKSGANDEMYVGISVLSNGVSVAELTTSLERPLIKDGKLTYTLSKGHLNAGVYIVTAALFKKQNREMIAPGHGRCTFKVEGHDITRGAALKLEDTWEYN